MKADRNKILFGEKKIDLQIATLKIKQRLVQATWIGLLIGLVLMGWSLMLETFSPVWKEDAIHWLTSM